MQGRCIAAPIQGPNGDVIAALSISGPEFRMSMKPTLLLAPELKKIYALISDALS